jgi:fructuronate reductase
LRDSVVAIASAWASRGFASEDFLNYLRDPGRVSFPWSMIDKITPRPSDEVTRRLTSMGIIDMAPITTSKGTYIAPFVNAEIPQYLVLEDSFPNGRPAFESASVYLSDRDTVNRTERMKVTTCLNPLHTALAVFGCLLGYSRISDEMKDPDLRDLVYAIGKEGLPVVTDPKIMDPREFLREVLEERFPNPFIPDMPQRIATDTSLKLPIRYGETIKAYLADEHLVASDLTYIPLAIAGWFRYLIGMDDDGEPMEVSPDPQLPMLRQALSAVRLGDPGSRGEVLFAILRNDALFGTDLVDAGLATKIDTMFGHMLEGNGAVRRILHKLCHSGENVPA